MSPHNRPQFPPNADLLPIMASTQAPCHERSAVLDLLQGFSLPDACNLECWLDQIEGRRSGGVRL
jgi:hypothetical protein